MQTFLWLGLLGAAGACDPTIWRSRLSNSMRSSGSSRKSLRSACSRCSGGRSSKRSNSLSRRLDGPSFESCTAVPSQARQDCRLNQQ